MKTRIFILLLMVGLFTGMHCVAQKYFTGVWRGGTKGYALLSGLSWADFNTKWSTYGGQNLRLTNIKTYTYGGKRYFGGIWEEGTDGYVLTPLNLDWTAFSKFYKENIKGGQRLINVETYTDNGQLYFLGVFRAGTYRTALTPLGLDWTAFSKYWADSSKAGLRLVNIESYMYNGRRCYLGIFKAGTDGYVLSPYGMDYNAFKAYWAKQSPALRLIDVETFVDNGKQIYMGVWREGNDGYVLWGGQVDWESFTSKWAECGSENLRLIDFETYDGPCDYHCLNQVLLPDDATTPGRESYNYRITGGPLHCEGVPGSCPAVVPDSNVAYRWPNLQLGDNYYMRNSVIWDATDQIFTLPFKDAANVMSHNGWLYSANNWHQGVDFSKTGAQSFQVVAAAPGRVIHIGWDTWSGNTIVISHDVGAKKDVYRTIYMHLHNGPMTDCNNAWARTVPTLPANADVSKDLLNNYKHFLNATGCTQATSTRNPQAAYWGTAAQTIDQSLVGKTVKAGDVLGWSGSTGPGGCNCSDKRDLFVNTHLHMFFAHRDPVNHLWYLYDPYGVYAYGDCYLPGVTTAGADGCARYPTVWKGGKPEYAK